ARGRAHGRVEGQVVEVRIPDPHPRQGADLKVPVADVRIEGAPLVGAHLERDPDGGEFRLDRLRQTTRTRLGRGLVEEPEAGEGARGGGGYRAGCGGGGARCGWWRGRGRGATAGWWGGGGRGGGPPAPPTTRRGGAGGGSGAAFAPRTRRSASRGSRRLRAR